jgi:hypothetical protein
MDKFKQIFSKKKVTTKLHYKEGTKVYFINKKSTSSPTFPEFNYGDGEIKRIAIIIEGESTTVSYQIRLENGDILKHLIEDKYVNTNLQQILEIGKKNDQHGKK